MKKYVLKRLLSLIPTIFIVSVVIFLLVHLSRDGGFASAEAIPHATRTAKPQIAPKVALPKGARGRSESPLVASAEAKSLHNNTEIG